MAIVKTTKQGWEEYFIAGSIIHVQKDGIEKVVLGTSTIEAIDSEGDDALAVIVDVATKKLDDDTEGSYTDNMLAVKCKGGVEDKSPYIVTFKMVTTEGQKWETEMKVVVKEIVS